MQAKQGYSNHIGICIHAHLQNPEKLNILLNYLFNIPCDGSLNVIPMWDHTAQKYDFNSFILAKSTTFAGTKSVQIAWRWMAKDALEFE